MRWNIPWALIYEFGPQKQEKDNTFYITILIYILLIAFLFYLTLKGLWSTLRLKNERRQISLTRKLTRKEYELQMWDTTANELERLRGSQKFQVFMIKKRNVL